MTCGFDSHLRYYIIKLKKIEKQLKYDLAYLKMALEWGKLSHCERKKVGAIIVKNNMIISEINDILSES